MSPAAEKFATQVEAIDAELGKLVRGELERGVNLYAMMELLQTSLAAKRAMDAIRPSSPSHTEAGE